MVLPNLLKPYVVMNTRVAGVEPTQEAFSETWQDFASTSFATRAKHDCKEGYLGNPLPRAIIEKL